MLYMRSPPRHARTRQEELSLSPRPSLRHPPGRHGEQERLPSIQDILPEIPPRGDERSLSRLRSPLQHNPEGPCRSTGLPAHLSPPPPSRRPQLVNTNDQSGSRRDCRKEDAVSPYMNRPAPSSFQFPVHSGPPQIRSEHSSSSSPASPSPYPGQLDLRPAYSSTHGEASGLPPPPLPHYNSLSMGTDMGRGYQSGDLRHGSPLYSDILNGGTHNAYQSPGSIYGSVPCGSVPYGYPVPPPPDTSRSNGYQYSDGYPRPMQFENEDMGGQVPKKRRGNLPRHVTDILKLWFEKHLAHPYPDEQEKQMLCRDTGLAMIQVSNWFINSRRRRVPELVNQATAEKRLREGSGDSSGSSD